MAVNQAAVHEEYAQLQERSHAVGDLADLVLPYIERDWPQWTASQSNAYDHLRWFLDHAVAQNTLQSQLQHGPAFGTHLISCIGVLFLRGRLENVEFRYHFDEAPVAPDNAIGYTTTEPPSPIVSVHVNAAHETFRDVSDEQWRLVFLNTLLLQAISTTSSDLAAFPQHTTALMLIGLSTWSQKLSNVAHQQSSGSTFTSTARPPSWRRLRPRIQSTSRQMSSTGVWGMDSPTIGRATHCISVELAFSQHSNARGRESRVNNGAPHNSLIGPARYPVQSNGAGGDLLIVDMQT